MRRNRIARIALVALLSLSALVIVAEPFDFSDYREFEPELIFPLGYHVVGPREYYHSEYRVWIRSVFGRVLSEERVVDQQDYMRSLPTYGEVVWFNEAAGDAGFVHRTAGQTPQGTGFNIRLYKGLLEIEFEIEGNEDVSRETVMAAAKQLIFGIEQWAQREGVFDKAAGAATLAASGAAASGDRLSSAGDSTSEISPAKAATAATGASLLALLAIAGFLRSSGLTLDDYLQTLRETLWRRGMSGAQIDDVVAETRGLTAGMNLPESGTPTDGMRDPSGRVYSSYWKGWVDADRYDETAAQTADGKQWVEGRGWGLADGARRNGLVYSDHWQGWISETDYAATSERLANGETWMAGYGWQTRSDMKRWEQLTASNLRTMRRGSQGMDPYIREAYEDLQTSRSKLAATRAAIRESVRREEHMQQLRQKLDSMNAELAARSEGDYWGDVWKFYQQNRLESGGEIWQFMRDSAVASREAKRAALKTLSDPQTWKTLAKGTAENVRYVARNPVSATWEGTKAVGRVAAGGARLINRAGVYAICHPIDTAKMLTGVDMLERAFDSSEPTMSRIGCAAFGFLDVGLTVATGGGAKAAALGGQLVDAARATRVGKHLDEAMGALARQVDPGDFDNVLRLRREHWAAANQRGVDRLEDFTRARQSGDPHAIREAALAVQTDKRAIHHLNNGDAALYHRVAEGDRDALVGDFNRVMGDLYDEVDPRTVRGIWDETGGQVVIDGQTRKIRDVVIEKPTNPSDVIKAGADRDVTARLVLDDGTVVDFPHGKLQTIYEENLLRSVRGDAYVDSLSATRLAEESGELAHTLDQVATSRLHSEAYGRCADDLDTALHGPERFFTDAEQVGKAIAYKGHHWFDEAGVAFKEGRHLQAEEFLAEGMRQTTKQFRNQLLRRYEALVEAGVPGLKAIPDELSDAVALMRHVEDGLVSPADIQHILRKMGTSVDEVATHLGEYIAAMQKLDPRLAGAATQSGLARLLSPQALAELAKKNPDSLLLAARFARGGIVPGGEHAN